MKIVDCTKCKHFDWEQDAKYFGHPCDIHGGLRDLCDDFEDKDCHENHTRIVTNRE